MNGFTGVVTTEREIEDILGHPSELTKQKVIDYLDVHCKEFIKQTPLLFLSTADRNGYCVQKMR